MLRSLAILAPASRRLVLVCYADQFPDMHRVVWDRLQDRSWAPTPDDCPVDWTALERWYLGLQRTGDLVMDSY